MSARAVVRDGSRLLAGHAEGPGLDRHRHRYGDLPLLDRAALVDAAHRWDVRGCGGAGFPFAAKLAALRRGRPVVVVNASEGEPVSRKDAALAVTRPHLVLDGAVATARALGTRAVHVVVPAETASVRAAFETALAERRRERVHVTVHDSAPGFVSGQASAVLELMAGRPNLPVTAWSPAAVAGHRGRPTLLCNAETWAQVAVRLLPGSAPLAPTTLLTLDGETAPVVVEAVLGTPWAELLPRGTDPLLVGGYHGTWAPRRLLAGLTVDRDAMAAAGVPLGAGSVVPLRRGECPVRMTARVTAYLARQSAGRCGPCRLGLPSLAESVRALAAGRGDVRRLRELAGLVTGRGACAHPDGTARLVASLLDRFPDEVAAHLDGHCVAPARDREVAA